MREEKGACGRARPSVVSRVAASHFGGKGRRGASLHLGHGHVLRAQRLAEALLLRVGKVGDAHRILWANVKAGVSAQRTAHSAQAQRAAIGSADAHLLLAKHAKGGLAQRGDAKSGAVGARARRARCENPGLLALHMGKEDVAG